MTKAETKTFPELLAEVPEHRNKTAQAQVKEMVIAQPVDRIEVKKDCEITIHRRMTAEQFLGRKTEKSA